MRRYEQYGAAVAPLRRIVREAPADVGLLDDLADVRSALVEDD
jgi:hypothetical protein